MALHTVFPFPFDAAKKTLSYNGDNFLVPSLMDLSALVEIISEIASDLTVGVGSAAAAWGLQELAKKRQRRNRSLTATTGFQEFLKKKLLVVRA